MAIDGPQSQQLQVRQMPSRNLPVFKDLQPSIVTLLDAGKPCGYAAMIDESGLYVANRSTVAAGEVEGRFWNGTLAHLHVIGQDSSTQLVLLRSDYVPVNAKPVSAPVKETEPGTPLLLVMEGGSVQGRIVSNDMIGIVRPSDRPIPLSEIRFETPIGSLAGALVFTETGDFVGVLSATLTRRVQPVSVFSNFAAPIDQTAQAAGGQLLSRHIGPADLTVAYMPGVDAVRRVVDGFLSPSHQIAHPSMGVFCINAARGALITLVQPGSPADKAGIHAADMIIGIGNYLIRNQVDFAKVLLRQKPGDHVIVRLDRGGRLLMRTVIIGQTSE
jgi:S1-C subfamily serine protease